MLLIATMFAASQSNGQIKPSDSGYGPVNGIKVNYEVHGEGKPIVLLHGAFMTIRMNCSLANKLIRIPYFSGPHAIHQSG